MLRGIIKKKPYSFSASPDVMKEFHSHIGFQSASKLIESFIINYNKQKSQEAFASRPAESIQGVNHGVGS